MAWSLSASVGGTPYPNDNYTSCAYNVRLNWDAGSSFYGYPSNAGCFIRYNIGNGNVDVPISIAAPSSAGGSSAGYTTLASGTLNISHNANGVMNSVNIYASYSNGWVGDLTASDYVGNLQDFDRKPSSASSVSTVVNSNKTITVTANGVSSPAGTPTYYFAYSQNGGGYTGTQSGTSSSQTFSVPFGYNYQFRVYATNSDGTGGNAYSSSLFLPSGGKRFDGSNFVNATIGKRHNGSDWVDLTTAKRYDGSNWVVLS